MSTPLPAGKLPADLLARLLARQPVDDPRVVQGPGVGVDCAVVGIGDSYLALKSDPITFATDEIGWYGVQVNANDIATTGATPRWLLVTLLLPAGQTTADSAETIFTQIYNACDDLNVAVVGGHTEITTGLDRPLFLGAMIGEAEPDELVLAGGAQPGDQVLLTKGVPIEATAILAREFPDRLRDHLSDDELRRAADYLTTPGISVLRDAQIATSAGRVTAMHDPTEGGLAAALWELAQAAGVGLTVDVTAVPIPDLSRRICDRFGLDPLAAIASGALLITAALDDADAICRTLREAGIACAVIGQIEEGDGVWQVEENGREALPWPERDEIARLYEGL